MAESWFMGDSSDTKKTRVPLTAMPGESTSAGAGNQAEVDRDEDHRQDDPGQQHRSSPPRISVARHGPGDQATQPREQDGEEPPDGGHRSRGDTSTRGR